MNNKTLPLGKLPAQLLNELISELPLTDPDLIVAPGIGRDAAGIKIGKRQFAITTDPITLASNHQGAYSVAVNLNDIACMGCRPRWYLAAVLLPKDTTEKQVRELWQDIKQNLNKYNIQQIGGHIEVTTAVTTPVVVGQMIGESIGKQLLNIGDSRPDDKLLLWQRAAIEGTALIALELENRLAQHFTANEITNMQNLLEDPGICVWSLVEKLVPIDGLVALHDPTEGGIATALHEVADAGNCGFKVDVNKINLLPATKKLSEIFNFDPLGLLASGSIIIVVKAEAEESILQKLSGEPIATIGSLVTDKKQRNLPRYDRDEIINVLYE